MPDSKQHATAIAVSIALLTTGEHAVAQSASEMETRLQVGTVTSTRSGTLPLNAMALTPSLRYEDRRLSFNARGTAWLGGRDFFLGAASAELGAYVPLMYGIRGEVVGNASRVFFEPELQNDQVDAEARLHFMRQRGGVWLGSGVARPLRVSAVSNVNVSSGGVWTKLGATTLRGTVTSFFFTKFSTNDTVTNPVPCAARLESASGSVPDLAATASASGSASGCRYQTRITDLEGSVRYEHKLAELTVRGGRRLGTSLDVSPESRNWASAQAAVWLSSQVAAVAGGGREPAQPTRGLPARTYGSLGVMLAYWPIPRGSIPIETPASLIKAFDIRPAGSAVQRVTARIGGVESVEVMGDFSDWVPLPLVRRGRDMWELLIPMNPGVHQINVRIDAGQWIAPPGVPTMRDGFNGEVGVLIIRP